MSTVVETACGKVEGPQQDGIHIFKGIPFAAPPVGERRWLPPQPVEPWTGIRDAGSFSAMAPQIIVAPDPENPLVVAFNRAEQEPQSISEDCLYLNVWTPGCDSARRPVMVWIHGGGFTNGSGTSPMYDGGLLSRRGDVVLVTINYRLNVFGFLRLHEVTGGKVPSSGSEGMLDQVTALEWVRDNIERFGGDPDNVTIFGESAGGGSVGNLLGMPSARGLFHKAISQSGSAHAVIPKDGAARYGEHFLGVLEVSPDDIDGLQSVDMKRILAAYARSIPMSGSDTLGPLPVYGGPEIPEIPIDSVAAGSADGIPVMAGALSDEWRLWMAMDPAIDTLTEEHMLARFRKSVRHWDPREIIEAYRHLLPKRGVRPSPSEIYLAIMTARMFRIPTIRLLETVDGRGNPAYGYLMTWRSPYKGGKFGACHAVDLGFLWGMQRNQFFGPGPAADALAGNVQDAWLAFARTGNPSCEGLGRWPTYGDKRVTMILGERSGIEDAPDEDERLIWQGTGYEAFRWG